MKNQKHKDKLVKIKELIKNGHDYFNENYTRFNDCKRFVYVTTLDETEKSLLQKLNKPIIEANVLEAYISRLIGEFSKHLPSIEVSACDYEAVDPEVINFVEGHIRYIIDESNKSGMEIETYKDTLSGGYSSVKVYTEYAGEKSFDQDICVRRAYDPTLCGWDPMAVHPSKADAKYCYEIFPKRLEELEEEYPNREFKFQTSNEYIGDYQWSYKDGSNENVMLVVDFYEKKNVRKRIVMLADGQVMTTDEYKKFLENWEAEGRIEQAPIVVGEPRWTSITKIMRYRLTEREILEEEETDYKELPLIFIDGNSTFVKTSTDGPVKQMTRPYIYNAMGIQKFQNFTIQTMAAWIENMSMAQWTVPKDSIPNGYEQPWVQPQLANVLVYNAYKDNNPSIPLPPPQRVPTIPLPPEVQNAMQYSPALIQNILGSFDASMTKLTEQQVSGIAIQETATLSNAAAMPYIVNWMQGLQSAANIIVQLLPLYYKTPRTIPVMNAQGEKSFVKINQEGGISFDYDSNALKVKVEPGVSFGVQKSRALQQIQALSSSSPFWAEFFSVDAPDIVADNIECRGQDEIKVRAKQFREKKQKQMQMAQQQAQQQPQAEMVMAQAAQRQVEMEAKIQMAKIQQQDREQQADSALRMSELQAERERTRIELLKVLADIKESARKNDIALTKAQSDAIAKAAEIAIKQESLNRASMDKHLDRTMARLEKMEIQEKHEIEEIEQ